MSRTYQYSDAPCDHCRRPATDPARGLALHITDARPLDLTYTDARTGLPAGAVHESNPGEPKLCDDCELRRREADPLYRSMVGLPPLG